MMRGSVEAIGGERWEFIPNVSGKTGGRCSLYNADRGSNPEAHGRSPCNVPPANEAHHPTQQVPKASGVALEMPHSGRLRQLPDLSLRDRKPELGPDLDKNAPSNSSQAW